MSNVKKTILIICISIIVLAAVFFAGFYSGVKHQQRKDSDNIEQMGFTITELGNSLTAEREITAELKRLYSAVEERNRIIGESLRRASSIIDAIGTGFEQIAAGTSNITKQIRELRKSMQQFAEEVEQAGEAE